MASAKIVLKTGKTYKDGTHPIVLRIIHKQKQKTITLSETLRAKKEDWVFENSRYKEERLEGGKIVKVSGAKAKNKALNKLDEKSEKILLQFEDAKSGETGHLIPEQSVQYYRLKVVTDSGSNWSGKPVQSGQIKT